MANRDKRDRARTRLRTIRTPMAGVTEVETGITDDKVVDALLGMFSSRDHRVKLGAIGELARWRKEAGEFSDNDERFFGERSVKDLSEETVGFLSRLGFDMDKKKENLFFVN
jgi:hypothetical protein